MTKRYKTPQGYYTTATSNAAADLWTTVVNGDVLNSVIAKSSEGSRPVFNKVTLQGELRSSIGPHRCALVLINMDADATWSTGFIDMTATDLDGMIHEHTVDSSQTYYAVLAEGNMMFDPRDAKYHWRYRQNLTKIFRQLQKKVETVEHYQTDHNMILVTMVFNANGITNPTTMYADQLIWYDYTLVDTVKNGAIWK